MNRRIEAYPLDTTPIRSLRIFMAVAEAGSLSAAAAQLHLSLSTVSKRLAALEDALGYPLVYRNTRRIALTDAGRIFYRRCRSAVREIDQAAHPDGDLGADGRALTGHLRVVVSPAFGTAMMAPALTAFQERHPRVTIDVIVMSAMPNLVRERIDVAIMMRASPETKTASVRLARNPRLLCAAPHYLEHHGTPQTPDDLAHHACLVSLLSGVTEVWQLRRADGTRAAAPISVAAASNDGNFLKSACLAGSGVAHLYAFHVREELRDGRLVEVLAAHRPAENTIFAVYPHQKIVLPHVTAFVDFLRETIGDPPALIPPLAD